MAPKIYVKKPILRTIFQPVAQQYKYQQPTDKSKTVFTISRMNRNNAFDNGVANFSRMPSLSTPPQNNIVTEPFKPVSEPLNSVLDLKSISSNNGLKDFITKEQKKNDMILTSNNDITISHVGFTPVGDKIKIQKNNYDYEDGFSDMAYWISDKLKTAIHLTSKQKFMKRINLKNNWIRDIAICLSNNCISKFKEKKDIEKRNWLINNNLHVLLLFTPKSYIKDIEDDLQNIDSTVKIPDAIKEKFTIKWYRAVQEMKKYDIIAKNNKEKNGVEVRSIFIDDRRVPPKRLTEFLGT